MIGAPQPFIELSDVEYTQFRKALLRTKGSARQRSFLEGTRDTETFLEHMDGISTVGSATAPVIPEPLTENEFKESPTITENVIFETWSLLPPAMACRSTFWAYVTLDHIRHRRIEAPYLAANGGGLPGGRERIDHVLADTSDQSDSLVDRCVRTVLRRLGGLPEIRGNRSVYVDCPFARAWWRERWVKQASRGDPDLARHVRLVVRTSQSYWEKFIDRVVFRNSTFGDENLRGAFLRSLARFIRANPESDVRSAADMQRLCRRVTTYQGSRELSVLDSAELDELMAEVLANTYDSEIVGPNPVLTDSDMEILAAVARRQPVAITALEEKFGRARIGRLFDLDLITSGPLVAPGPGSPNPGARVTYIVTDRFLSEFGEETLRYLDRKIRSFGAGE